jgi:PAS domain S-box-containing protein
VADDAHEGAWSGARAVLRNRPMYSEHAEDLHLELDLTGRVTFLDAEGAALIGGDDAVGRLWFETYACPESAVEELERYLAFLSQDAATPTSHEGSIHTPGGPRRVLWHLVALRDPHGALLGARLAGALLTGEAHAEGMLRDALRRLHELRYAIDQSAIMAITDRRGRILHVNDRFMDISGYTRSELVGQTHRIINSGHHPTRFFQDMWATIGAGRVWRGDVCNRAKGGRLYWVATTIVPFTDDRGRPYQYLALRSEITERKEAEEALARSNRDLEEANRRIVNEHHRMLQAEKLSSVGMLAAGVAHEINNPLAGVMGCVKALRDGKVSEARRATYFATVIDGLERMQGIVQALLNYARPVQPTRTAVTLAEVVASCMLLISPHIHKKRLTLEHDVPEPPPRAEGDRAQLMQAVMNVLINAVHAAPEGSTVDVGYALDPERQRLGVVVTDRGQGIPPDQRDRVTDPFFSTKPEGQGTGLGLSVTLGIIQAHGGELAIASPSPGADHGTEVTLWLRAWSLAPGQRAPPAARTLGDPSQA